MSFSNFLICTIDGKSESRILPDHFMMSTRSSVKEMAGPLADAQLVSSLQQCSHSHSAIHPEISSRKQDSSHSTATPEPWFLFSRHFYISSTESLFKRAVTWISRGNARRNAGTAIPDFFKIIYGMLGKNGRIIRIIILMQERTILIEVMFNIIYVTSHVLHNQSKNFLNRPHVCVCVWLLLVSVCRSRV